MSTQEPEPLARVRLKLDINRALAKRNNQDYLSQIAFAFRFVPKTRWESVLEEMEREGMLTKVFTKRGAVLLVRCVTGRLVNPEHAVEDAVQG